MRTDPLQTLLRLRQRAVDDARRCLAGALTAASEAATAARQAERDIEDEARRAADPDGDDMMVEAFAAWLPAARQRVAQARAAEERQQADAARCRANLTVCRTALETIETLIATRQSERARALERRMQQTLDEAASHPPDPG